MIGRARRRPSARVHVGFAGVADEPANDAPYRLLSDVSFGEDVFMQSLT
jgi:hypothetical protein